MIKHFGKKNDLEGIEETVRMIESIYGESFMNISAPEYEDYELDITLTTTGGTSYPMEVKTTRYGNYLNNGRIAMNWYPCRNCPENKDSIGNNMRFADTPTSATSITDMTGWTTTMSMEELDADMTPIPDNMEGKPVYIINADMIDGAICKGKRKSKGRKLFDNEKSCLVYNMPDGFLIFNNKNLCNAFLGYCWYKTGHTTDIHPEDKKRWELKMVFDLTKAVYVPKARV